MDTPRTDAERFTVRVQDSTMRSLPVEVVHASFADKLERESAALAAALQELVACFEYGTKEPKYILSNEAIAAYSSRKQSALKAARAALSNLRA